jgi:hypothetical protein
MIPRMRVISRVNSFYVHNTWSNQIVAGPFTTERNASRTVIALDGTRFEVKSLDTRYGVYDTHEDRFIGCVTDSTTTYVTEDATAGAYLARQLNDRERNESRLRQYRQRYPVLGELR